MNGFHERLFVALLCAASCCVTSCGAHPRRVEFGNLRAADRIQVIAVWDGNKRVGIITDRAKIERAATFIDRYRDGWIDVWTGPRAPLVLLDFYEGERYLGDFGLSDRYLVAGSLSRDVDAGDIASLARDLGLKWPPG